VQTNHSYSVQVASSLAYIESLFKNSLSKSRAILTKRMQCLKDNNVIEMQRFKDKSHFYKQRKSSSVTFCHICDISSQMTIFVYNSEFSKRHNVRKKPAYTILYIFNYVKEWHTNKQRWSWYPNLVGLTLTPGGGTAAASARWALPRALPRCGCCDILPTQI